MKDTKEAKIFLDAFSGARKTFQSFVALGKPTEDFASKRDHILILISSTGKSRLTPLHRRMTRKPHNRKITTRRHVIARPVIKRQVPPTKPQSPMRTEHSPDVIILDPLPPGKTA